MRLKSTLPYAILLGLAIALASVEWSVRDAQEERPSVLVFKSRTFQGRIVNESDVKVRALKETEMADYRRYSDQFLPPNSEVIRRIALTRTVDADVPLVKRDFHFSPIAEERPSFLEPGMRAVNLQLPPERIAGGDSRSGDYVDVCLTCEICDDPACTAPKLSVAPLVRGAQVIAHRLDTRLSTAIPVTLQLNPYRAALIEFAKNRGEISLARSSRDQRSGSNKSPINDDKEEERRVINLSSGISITDRDLETIFGLAVPSKETWPWPPVRFQGRVESKREDLRGLGFGHRVRIRRFNRFRAPPVLTVGRFRQDLSCGWRSVPRARRPVPCNRSWQRPGRNYRPGKGPDV
jgi:Flp pilus assembly protein CpaB